jgi:uncharacterized membrane protein YecN with MAPEG domain
MFRVKIPMTLTLPSLVTIAALVTYYAFGIKVGLTRAKCGIAPPKMTGAPELEQAIRVHENTLENLVLFIPILWLFSYYVSPTWGAGLGVVWIVGRILYAVGYYQAPEKRGPGFGISSLSAIALLIGALIGAVRTLL